MDEIKHGRYNPEKYTKEAGSILKGMQGKLDAASRLALLACLADGVSVQDSLSHTYVNPGGDLCFVYEDLLNGCCVEEFLQLLQKATAAEEIGQAVLAKFDKKAAAMKKSKAMRDLLLQAAQKQYEADLALMEAKQMNDATAESGDSAARADMLDKAADLMVKVHACDGLRHDMAVRYDSDVQARQSAGQKRDGLMQVALKTQEAQEVRKQLKKARND